MLKTPNLPLIRYPGRLKRYSYPPTRISASSLILFQSCLWKFLSISVLLYSIVSLYPEQNQGENVSFLETFYRCTTSFLENYVSERKFNPHQKIFHSKNEADHIHSYVKYVDESDNDVINEPVKMSNRGRKSFFFVSAQKKESYYKKLGIKKTATEKEIKKAWRKVSLELHPDKNPNNPDAAEKFAEASVAYDVLSNPEKRRVYDARGEEGVKQMEQQEAQGGGGGNPFAGFGGPFAEMFGFGFGGGGGGGDLKAEDTNLPLHVTYKQLYTGAVLDITYVRDVLCLRHEECTRQDDGCRGPGRRIFKQQLAPGFITQQERRDDSCVAMGKSWKSPCAACPGGKTRPEEVSLSIDLQPGMQNGQTIVFGEVGDEKPGHLAGDLVFHIIAKPHPHFVRKDDNLEVKATLSLVQALVGFDLNIQHVDGKNVNIQRTEVTPHGYVQVLKGQGMPKYGTDMKSYGDMIVTWEVKYPEVLSDKQKQEIKKILG